MHTGGVGRYSSRYVDNSTGRRRTAPNALLCHAMRHSAPTESADFQKIGGFEWIGS